MVEFLATSGHSSLQSLSQPLSDAYTALAEARGVVAEQPNRAQVLMRSRRGRSELQAVSNSLQLYVPHTRNGVFGDQQLDLRIPRSGRSSRHAFILARIRKDVAGVGYRQPFHSTGKGYEYAGDLREYGVGVGDLRPSGIDAVRHYHGQRQGGQGKSTKVGGCRAEEKNLTVRWGCSN